MDSETRFSSSFETPPPLTAVVITPVPMGLVRRSRSPADAFALDVMRSGGEDVRRLDEAQILRDPVDPRVVQRLLAHQDVLVVHSR